jgi:hypothetical protein
LNYLCGAADQGLIDAIALVVRLDGRLDLDLSATLEGLAALVHDDVLVGIAADADVDSAKLAFERKDTLDAQVEVTALTDSADVLRGVAVSIKLLSALLIPLDDVAFSAAQGVTHGLRLLVRQAAPLFKLVAHFEQEGRLRQLADTAVDHAALATLIARCATFPVVNVIAAIMRGAARIILALGRELTSALKPIDQALTVLMLGKPAGARTFALVGSDARFLGAFVGSFVFDNRCRSVTHVLSPKTLKLSNRRYSPDKSRDCFIAPFCGVALGWSVLVADPTPLVKQIVALVERVGMPAARRGSWANGSLTFWRRSPMGNVRRLDCLTAAPWEATNMTYLEAISNAPADADYIVYRDGLDYVFLKRHADGEIHVIAEVHLAAYGLIFDGIAARHQSLWDADSRTFDVGTPAQLQRSEWAENLSELVEY